MTGETRARCKCDHPYQDHDVVVVGCEWAKCGCKAYQPDTPARPVAGKADLRLGDTVRDPAGRTTGRVVDLNPLGWVDDPNERVTVQWRWAGWRSDPVVTELEVCRPRCSLCGKLPEQRCSCFSFPADVLRFEPEEIRALLRPSRVS